MGTFAKIDDKFIPLYRILWISATPHFCGEEDCMKEGHYEVMLEQGESIWAHSQEERDETLTAIEDWQQGFGSAGDLPDEPE